MRAYKTEGFVKGEITATRMTVYQGWSCCGRGCRCFHCGWSWIWAYRCWGGCSHSHTAGERKKTFLSRVHLEASSWHTHKLTARQSWAMCRLSWAELRSMRRNSVRSIPDRLLQRRPSMSASAKEPWRRSHTSHRASTEPTGLPGIKENPKGCQVQDKECMCNRRAKQISQNENISLWVLAGLKQSKTYIYCEICFSKRRFIICIGSLRLCPLHK